MTDYVPIPCAQYDKYEVTIMHRRSLRLQWCAGNILYRRLVRPLDLQTRSGEEFLICRTADGEMLSIRLDRIRKAEPV